MVEQEAAASFGVLSNADRLRVIRVLVEAGPEGMKAGDIAAKIGASPSRASFHLSALTEAGFIISDRRSRSIFYRVNFETIAGLVNFLMEDCCRGSATLRECCGG